MRDIFWLAGLLEGEGAFIIQEGKYPRIQVEMTDKDVIERVASLFKKDTRYKRSKGDTSRPTYVTDIGGPPAIGWMLTLYPLLGTRRRAKIREIIQLWKENHRNKGEGITGRGGRQGTRKYDAPNWIEARQRAQARLNGTGSI